MDQVSHVLCQWSLVILWQDRELGIVFFPPQRIIDNFFVEKGAKLSHKE